MKPNASQLVLFNSKMTKHELGDEEAERKCWTPALNQLCPGETGSLQNGGCRYDRELATCTSFCRSRPDLGSSQCARGIAMATYFWRHEGWDTGRPTQCEAEDVQAMVI